MLLGLMIHLTVCLDPDLLFRHISMTVSVVMKAVLQGAATLVQDDREGVAPVVVNILKAKSGACPPGAAASQQGPRIAGVPAAVLAKEAVYNAAGVGAYDLHDYIDFKQWLQSALLQVCQDALSSHSCKLSA